MLQIVDLQKSNFGDKFYVNVCGVPAGMPVDGLPMPKEHQCPIRIRLSSALPEHRSIVEAAFDLESDLFDDGRREEVIQDVVARLMLPFLAKWDGINSLALAIKEGAFDSGLVSKYALEHLGIRR